MKDETLKDHWIYGFFYQNKLVFSSFENFMVSLKLVCFIYWLEIQDCSQYLESAVLLESETHSDSSQLWAEGQIGIELIVWFCNFDAL